MQSLRALALDAFCKRLRDELKQRQRRINALDIVFRAVWNTYAKYNQGASIRRVYMISYRSYHRDCKDLADVPIAYNLDTLERVAIIINSRIKQIVENWERLMESLEASMPYVDASVFSFYCDDLNFAEELRWTHFQWRK